jgi:hypothetical protein
LTHLAVDHGFSTFVLWGVPTAPRLRMFIEEIAPAVKERVAARRESNVARGGSPATVTYRMVRCR